MSATSCKDDRICWLELKSELKVANLPPSDLDVNSFIKKHQQVRVNSFIKEQQQALTSLSIGGNDRMRKNA